MHGLTKGSRLKKTPANVVLQENTENMLEFGKTESPATVSEKNVKTVHHNGPDKAHMQNLRSATDEDSDVGNG